MELPGRPQRDGTAGSKATRHPHDWAVFTPMAFSNGLGWARITSPQLIGAAHITVVDSR